MTQFAERLRVEMARQQVTQADLGDRLGRTQTAVSYWASGKREPRLDDLARVASALDVSADYLLGCRLPPWLPTTSLAVYRS